MVGKIKKAAKNSTKYKQTKTAAEAPAPEKKGRMKKTPLIFTVLTLLLIAMLLPDGPSSEPSRIVLPDYNDTDAGPVLYLFWGDGCPHCHTELDFLRDLQDQYPSLRIRDYETWNDASNSELFSEMAEAFGFQARGVPATFLDDKYWVGFSDSIGAEIELKVRQCVETGLCKDAMHVIDPQEGAGELDMCLHIFMRPGCPQCGSIEPFVESVAERMGVALRFHDVSEEAGEELYLVFKRAYGIEHAGHPVLFMGDKFLLGKTAIRENLEAVLRECLADSGCICPLDKVRASTPSIPGSGDITPEDAIILDIPFFGRVDVSSMPIYSSTMLIAFADGFNPCSLWLISFLMGIVLYTGSRKKVFIVGITFLLVTAAAYGVFLVGALNVFSYIGQIFWIRLLVGVIAVVFAAVNIKDYFWYKKGLSFTISDSHKPGLIKKIRGIMHPNKSLLGMVGATILLALGVVLVELPCTAGFPITWSNLVAQSGVDGSEYGLLVTIYMLIYLAIEIIIFSTIILTMKVSKFQEKQGRILKLVGGCIMLLLGISMIFLPALMESLQGTFLLFIFAAWLCTLILVLHRSVLPKYGITIGSEFSGGDEEQAQQEGNKNGKNKE
jgi:glutaredoxin